MSWKDVCGSRCEIRPSRRTTSRGELGAGASRPAASGDQLWLQDGRVPVREGIGAYGFVALDEPGRDRQR